MIENEESAIMVKVYLTQNTVFRNMIPLKQDYPPLHVTSSITPALQLIQFRVFEFGQNHFHMHLYFSLLNSKGIGFVISDANIALKSTL